MNNAANNIVVSTKSLKGLLLEKRFTVGYFQREYKWKKENIEDLLIDLERSFFSNYDVNHEQKDVANYDKYCMGPIVLFQDQAEFSIVDGQQRITSFTLILIFLNWKYKEIFEQKDKLKGYIHSEYYGSEAYNLNIQDRNVALDFLFKTIPIPDNTILNESCTNILERYSDVAELFPPRLIKKEVFPLFLNWLTDNLVFIEILTQTSESAYTIFETMNDRGLKLTQSELLKSYLLSNVVDELKIKELDVEWKNKIGQINKYSADDDQNFFIAWLRAKYAVTVRSAEKGALNEDFEKIGTRYSNWVQESSDFKLNLDKKDPSTYYYFVHSDFAFYSDIYIKLTELEFSEELPEHDFRLTSYKGISSSLAYPLILSPILKLDDQQTILEKIQTTVKYLDAYAMYRLILNEPITHSSIRNTMYSKIKDIRNIELSELKQKLGSEIAYYKGEFLNQINYIPYNQGYAKYLLARLHKSKNPDIPFENFYFQRRKESYILYQFFNNDDVSAEAHTIPRGLKDLFISNLCSFCLLPKQLKNELDKKGIGDRIKYLIKENYLIGSDIKNFDVNKLQDFFISRNVYLKSMICDLWSI